MFSSLARVGNAIQQYLCALPSKFVVGFIHGREMGDESLKKLFIIKAKQRKLLGDMEPAVDHCRKKSQGGKMIQTDDSAGRG